MFCGNSDTNYERSLDLLGSSLLPETESGVDGAERMIPSITVDDLIRELGGEGPYLLKVDVQGAELDVLAGAVDTLKHTDFVILEVPFYKFFCNGPQFYDVMVAMYEANFVFYDICNLMYRPLDRSLAQADVIFVPDDGPLRMYHTYATPKQR